MSPRTCTHVYVAKARQGYKVGMSRNVPSRMKTLRVSLVRSWHCPDVAHLVERTAHDILAEQAIGGECFDVSESVAIEAVCTAVNRVAAGEHKRTAKQETLERRDSEYRAVWQRAWDAFNELTPKEVEELLAQMERNGERAAI